jgi:hypothetical protein
VERGLVQRVVPAAFRGCADPLNLLPAGSAEKADALVRMKHAELAARNVPGGYWVAASCPIAASYSLTGELQLKIVHRVAILTDGAARAVSPFKLYSWPDVFSALESDGPGELIKRVRTAEGADPMGLQHPRNKIHDDATIAVVEF